jgi:HSPB1-associated protein 1
MEFVNNNSSNQSLDFYETININEPILINDFINDVKGNEIIDSLLIGELSSTIISFRVAPLFKSPKTIRECDSIHIETSFYNFNLWRTNKISSTILNIEDENYNPFIKIPPFSSRKVFVYADYKHFQEIFTKIPNFINWNKLFLSNTSTPILKNDDTTLWMGTKGAHTPLHYDSYGCNIVTQVVGKKRWRLWKPTSPTSALSSSLDHNFPPSIRIPFEESSIYSSFDPLSITKIVSTNSNSSSYSNKNQQLIDIDKPNYDITLEQGDVLIVPKHYWHFVTTESDISLSVRLYIIIIIIIIIITIYYYFLFRLIYGYLLKVIRMIV